MERRLIDFAWHRPFAAALLATLLLCLGLFLATWGVATLRYAEFAADIADYGSLRARPAVPDDATATVSFRFKGATRFVTVPLAAEEIERSRALDTRLIFNSVGPVREAYLRTLVRTEARSAVIDRLVQRLRAQRDALALNDDQYVELMARFVQAIPYGVRDDRVHLPTQVLAENVAACDDRSVLLATLLTHEGYDTALFALDGLAHAAVGVRSDGPGFEGTGYAFIETNQPAFVGEAGSRYGSYAPWRFAPQVVRVGSGKMYRAEHEAAYIATTLRAAKDLARRLAPYTRLARTGPVQWRPAYAEAAEERERALQTVRLIEAYDYDRASLYRVLKGGSGSRL